MLYVRSHFYYPVVPLIKFTFICTVTVSNVSLLVHHHHSEFTARCFNEYSLNLRGRLSRFLLTVSSKYLGQFTPFIYASIWFFLYKNFRCFDTSSTLIAQTIHCVIAIWSFYRERSSIKYFRNLQSLLSKRWNFWTLFFLLFSWHVAFKHIVSLYM